MSKDIKIGVSIYSFTYFYDLKLMDLEDLLRTAHEMGYEGVEIVVAQMAPEYPNISDEWIAHFKELLDKYELHLVSWSAYIDMGLHPDRDLTDEEICEHTRRDLILAKKAGADLVRTQHAIKPKNFRAMLPFCKQLDMKLCIEMHAPHHPDVPVWKEYLEIMAEPESEGYLGVVPDFSIFQYAPHKQMIENYLRDGFREDKLNAVIELNKEPGDIPLKSQLLYHRNDLLIRDAGVVTVFIQEMEFSVNIRGIGNQLFQILQLCGGLEMAYNIYDHIFLIIRKIICCFLFVNSLI